MKTKIMSIILAVCLLLCGCSAGQSSANKKKFQASFLELFDTVTTIVGYADNEEEFTKISEGLRDELMVYHQLYDIYNDYPGINNIKTINDNAGVSPVTVDKRIIDLLVLCKKLYGETNGRVNVAMGSVLYLWHEARIDGVDDPENARIPDMEALKKAAEHTNIENVIIDEENSTVFLSDPKMRLDVGAVAKGFAAEATAKSAPEGLLISVGGNVCATGPRPDKNRWIVGLQNPDLSETYLHTVWLTKGAVVTSGDYQRYYMVDGEAYHHIIDPDTLMPAEYWRAVSVIVGDSGIADALSTALFLMNREDGEALIKKFGAVALWVDKDGNEYYSEGFKDFLRT
ncbi:MAG: FAD:protein FMN transferase [Eubacteriales bacterium]|nr:FAD:protein FMN transferase [Eubacteriales bacterium]